MIIIKHLIFTENVNQLLERYNKYIFEVDYYLTKIQICWIVEKIFSIPVQYVNTLRQPLIIDRIKNFNSMCRKRAIVSIGKEKKIRLILCKNEFALFWIYKFWYSLYYF